MVTANLEDEWLLTSREQKLKELEKLFANWANFVEDDLFDNQRRLDSIGGNNLVNDFKLYSKQIEELNQLDIEYKALSYSDISYPDCSRTRLRLTKLCALTINEFTRRFYNINPYFKMD